MVDAVAAVDASVAYSTELQSAQSTPTPVHFTVGLQGSEKRMTVSDRDDRQVALRSSQRGLRVQLANRRPEYPRNALVQLMIGQSRP
jgi:hypothetical protein